MKSQNTFSFITACVCFLEMAVLGEVAQKPVDRRALVTRHNIELRRFDSNNPLSVGNGEFAFTVDATGLQTFADEFTNTIPLGTLSQWGWHTFPNPGDWSADKFHYKEFDVFGRKVPYNDVPGNRQTPEIRWLRADPHRLHLGQIGFVLTKSDGTPARTNDLTEIEQTLDLWNGSLRSRFKFEGQPVEVETICDPDRDLIAVHVSSPLVKSGGLKIKIRFPYGTGSTITADWAHPDAHETLLTQPSPIRAEFARKLDDNVYFVSAQWSSRATLAKVGKHEFVLAASPSRAKAAHRIGPLEAAPMRDRPPAAIQRMESSGVDTIEFVCEFRAVSPAKDLPGFSAVRAAVCKHWNDFWKAGGAIDLSGSTDPRWFELERRIVLSQYLTAIQCAGSLPPQETGLTYNSWEGKFHLEMHWWHAAHFALWNRLPLLEKSLGYYDKILPRAQRLAKKQGYTGARWPKMADPSGVDSPSPVGPFLIWQQPHPIFYAELCYRQHPNQATLMKFKNVVFHSADFMSSYAEWDAERKRFVLGPVLQCAQEIFPKTNTLDPTFELTYWRWGLEIAQQWRQRLGMPRDSEWQNVLKNLAVPALESNKYLFAETATGTYSDKKWTDDHPSVTAAFGMLPGPGIDRETMRRTLHWIWDNWNWPDTWGWDYGMLAMCAARLGEPERAIDALLLDTPKNHIAINGHNYQRPGLTIYLPGNGSLLYATAMMAAGWDGAPKTNAPGFPKNGKWNVRYENLKQAP
jgi:hypothetical protein